MRILPLFLNKSIDVIVDGCYNGFTGNLALYINVFTIFTQINIDICILFKHRLQIKKKGNITKNFICYFFIHIWFKYVKKSIY